MAVFAPTHGWSRTPEYRAWKALKSRCKNPASDPHGRYHGRGITVDARWVTDFTAFLAEVGPRPTAEHSIDRRDNTRGYEPGNVRWATRTEQRRNRTDPLRLLTLNGVTRCLRDWATVLGIPEDRIARRLRYGWPVDAALTAAKHTRH